MGRGDEPNFKTDDNFGMMDSEDSFNKNWGVQKLANRLKTNQSNRETSVLTNGIDLTSFGLNLSMDDH